MTWNENKKIKFIINYYKTKKLKIKTFKSVLLRKSRQRFKIQKQPKTKKNQKYLKKNRAIFLF